MLADTKLEFLSRRKYASSFYRSCVSFFTGCGVGSVVAMPLKVTGAAVNVIAPKVVGNTLAKTGEIVEDNVPF